MIGSILDYALFYYEHGLCPIPVVYGGKNPVIKWRDYQQKRPEKQQIIKWFQGKKRNIGLIVGTVSNNLVTLDFENPTFYGQFFKKGLEKKTWVVKTGKGIHVHLVSAEKIANRKISDKNNQLTLEIRANNQIVVMPPSLHPSGVHYQFLCDPRQVNIAIVENLEQSLRKRCEQLGWKGFPKTKPFKVSEVSVKHGKVFRGKHPICVRALLRGVKSGKRDETAIRLAQYFHVIRGASVEKTLKVLLTWNKGNDPPIGTLLNDPRDINSYFMEKIRQAKKTTRFGCSSFYQFAGLCVGKENCKFFKFNRKRRRKEKWSITISRSM
jgi:hypothetical protein